MVKRKLKIRNDPTNENLSFNDSKLSLEDRLDPATKMMLNKSSWLISESKKDTRKFRKRENKTKLKSLQNKQLSQSTTTSQDSQIDTTALQSSQELKPSINAGDNASKQSGFDLETLPTPDRKLLPAIVSASLTGKSHTVFTIDESSVSIERNRPQKEGERKTSERRKSSQWEGRTVTEHPENALMRSEWENEIARHIISVYATTKAGPQNLSTTSMLLKFAESGGPKANEITSTLFEDRPLESREDLIRAENNESRVANRVRSQNSDSVSVRAVNRSQIVVSKSKAVTSTTGSAESDLDKHVGEDSMDEAQSQSLSSLDLTAFPSKLRASFTIRTKSGGKLNVRGPPRCFPIWFVSTGDVYADWTDMPGGGGAELQSRLTDMFERREYKEYLRLVEAVMVRSWAHARGEDNAFEEIIHPRASPVKPHVPKQERRSRRGRAGSAEGNDEDEDDNSSTALASAATLSLSAAPGGSGLSLSESKHTSLRVGQEERGSASITSADVGVEAERLRAKLIVLWKQLIVTANAFGILCVERRQFSEAMSLLRYAERKCGRDDLLSYRDRQECRAHVCCALAFFFFKRKRTRAALAHCSTAVDIYRDLGELQQEAVALLRLAACQCQLSDFKASHKVQYPTAINPSGSNSDLPFLSQPV